MTQRHRSSVAVIKPLNGTFDEGASSLLCGQLDACLAGRAVIGLRQTQPHGPVRELEVSSPTVAPNLFKSSILLALADSDEECFVEFKDVYVFQEVA